MMLLALIVLADIIFSVLLAVICVLLSRTKNGKVKVFYFAFIVDGLIVLIIFTSIALSILYFVNILLAVIIMPLGIIPFITVTLTSHIITGVFKHSYFAPLYFYDMRNSLRGKNK